MSKRLSFPVLIGRRRSRDLAFIEQLMAAQIATKRDADRQASADVASFVAETRMAVGARKCSLDDLCRAIRNAQPSHNLIDDDLTEFDLPNEPTPAQRPRARAVDRLLKRILGPLWGGGSGT